MATVPFYSIPTAMLSRLRAELLLFPILGLLHAAAADELIADFEGSDYGNWVVTGNAFGKAPARGTLPEQAPVTGFRGEGLVNTYLNGDKSTGTLTSPELTLTHRYLSFLIGGGAEERKTCVNVIVDGTVVRSATGREDETLSTLTFDLGDYAGKKAKIQIVDDATGGWGHILADHFVFSDTAATPPYFSQPLNTETLYEESYRPQFHFSAQKGWLNDPNGLVYFGGEYHLYFQHNPKGTQWGNMTWGHAVSTNLLEWNQLEHALHPDAFGTMFSGSAVVDAKNTGGFKTGKEPALVAFYTAAGGTSEESKGKPFTQCLAYSNDRGRTWTKYNKNPILGNLGEGDRDPKVFWHEPSHHWVMPLYIGEKDPSKLNKEGKPTTRNVCLFYTSTDLKQWTFASKFGEELYECPGFVELAVDGGTRGTKWVLWGASGDYWVGRFDGQVFTPEAPKKKADFGSNFYAAQAYDDLPDHRVILVGWLQGGKYPGMPFNQQMGFPVELSLQSSAEGARLIKWPISEIRQLFTSVQHEELKQPFPAGSHVLSGTNRELADLELEFIPGSAKTVVLDLRGNRFEWNAAAGELTAFGRKVPVPVGSRAMGRRTEFRRPWGPDYEPWERSVRLRFLIDRTSIELFVNGGTAAASYCFVPRTVPTNTLTVEGGDLARCRFTLRELKSAWKY